MRKTKPLLPVIESCEGCGACCRDQESPPGYALILSDPSIRDDPGPFAEDVARFDRLPERLVDELRAYVETLKDQRRGDQERPCIWLDTKSGECRHYEHRPSICRDAVEVGDEVCRTARLLYQVQPSW